MKIYEEKLNSLIDKEVDKEFENLLVSNFINTTSYFTHCNVLERNELKRR